MYPLTPAQSLAFLQHQFAPTRSRFQVACYDLSSCSEEAVTAAVDTLFHSFSSLRLALVETQDHAVLAATNDDPAVKCISISQPADETVGIQHVWRWIDELDATIADADHALHLHLFRRRDDSAVLAIAADHIFIDAASFAALPQLLASVLDNEVPDPVEHDDDLPAAIHDDRLAPAIDYWTSKIGDHTCTMPRLKVDAPLRPEIQSVDLDSSVASQLHTLAQKMDVEPLAVLTAGIQVFIAAQTGSADVIFAYPTSDDQTPPPSDPIGNRGDQAFFRSTTPLDRTFKELVEANASQIRNDRYFHLPIVEVASALHHRFRTHVVSTNVQIAQAAPLPARCCGGTMELTLRPELTIHHISDELEIRYNLAQETVALELLVDESVKGYLEMLCEGLASTFSQLLEHADDPIDTLELLTPSLRKRLISTLNVPCRHDDALPKTLHGVIEHHAMETPEADAIRDADSASTFEVFNAAANQFARHLLDVHANASRPTVAILMSRASRIATAVLAALKTGGRYVVIDDEYPDSRIQYIIDDSGSHIVITDQDNVARLEEMEITATVANVDDREFQEHVATHDPSNLDIETSSDDFAYIIYTSGTTGKPKGIQVIHRNVLNLFTGCIDLFGTSGEARHGHLNSFSFDATVIGLWFSLLSGNELVVLSREEFMTPGDLANAIRKYRLTHAFVPNALVNSYGLEAPGTFADLKFLSYGGEKPNYASLVNIHRQCVGLRQLNVYGPSEITVMCTADVIDPTKLYSQTVPIGLPLSNYACYIVDAHGHLQLPGAPGELWISGESLAQGYINLPEKTAAAFIPNPFHDDTPDSIGSTSRCYRSGDLVRWLPDHRIEFMGRIDAQVKIRGFRIELDEVTEAVRRSSGVSNAVVVATVLPGAQEKDLVAFVISDRPNPDEVVFRTQLEEILPHYMIPRHILFLEEFPCTTSGKFDTKALIATLGESHVEDQPQDDERGTGQERSLREVLVDVIGEHAAIGIDEDIFALGVHSLMLSRFVSRVQKQWDVPLTLRNVTEARTLSRISAVIDDLRGADRHQQFEIVRGDDGGRSGPASHLQEIFWLISAKENDASANVAMAIHLDGDLDLPAMARALERLVERHGVFRTTYQFEGESLSQYVHDSIEHQIDLVDLTQEPLETRLSKLGGLLEHHRTNVFDLSAGPLFEFTLIRTEATRSILALSVHHSIYDGSSLEVFFRDLGAFYESEIHGVDPVLPAIDGTYVDYSMSQRTWLKDGTLDEQLEYWRDQVADASPERVQIPGTIKAASDADDETIVIRNDIPEPHLERIDRLIERLGLSRFTFFCSIYTLCMQRLSQLDDINVSVVFANRNHAEFDEIVGSFVNTLFINKKLSPMETVGEYLTDVHHSCMAMLDHQDIPRMVLNEMFPPDATKTTALAYAYQAGIDFDGSLAPGLTYAIEELYPGPVDDATLLMEEGPDALISHMRFNPAFVDESTAQAISKAFLTLVQSTPDLLEEYAAKTSVVSATHAATLIQRSQAKETADRTATLIGLLVDQMKRTPDRCAVSDHAGSMTYRELDIATATMAGDLGDRMTELGDTSPLIALCIDRSMATITTILSIMRAGYGYVSLDPSQPVDRLRFIASHSGAKLIVADQKHHAHFNELDVTLVTPQECHGSADNAIDTPLATPAAPAWVIFTSGTTGRPKGVEITQRNGAHFVRVFSDRYALTQEDVFTACASYSFDYSTIENFMPLANGGRCHIVESSMMSDPAALVDLIESAAVTVFSQTPAAFQNTIEVVRDRGGLSHWPRYVNLGGESLVIENLEPWFAIDGSDATVIMNIYGITETTCMSSSYPVTKKDLGVHRFTPIGLPFPDQSFYILDNHLNPIPDGLMGELYIGGAGIADGYIGQFELSRERFLLDPFTQAADDFMYKSGDLVIRDSEGLVHYVGRTDSQINMRGIRIELGEIESVLSSHPAINKCFVTDFTTDGGEQMIVAYWTPADEVSIDDDLESSFKAHLEELLPVYMIPSRFVAMESLPLTTNGKVDAKSLPSPLLTGDRTSTPPSTPTQRQIATLWSEILHTPEDGIGVDDNFYEIGGNSLLLARVLFRLRKDLPDLDFDNTAVHATPTIKTMAGDTTDAAAIDPVEQALADCHLPPSMPTISAASDSAMSDPRHILLTGTTGFLGAHLLARLLETTTATITCAVRGATPLERQVQSLRRLDLLPDRGVLEDRVRFLRADLAKPRLGIDDAKWQSLAEETDVILHCGAWVHHLFDYATLRDSNVGSTTALLELAALGSAAMTMVSTISAGSIVEDHVFLETGPGPVPLIPAGYPMTKYVAERIIAQFQEKGGTATVVRPGNISADTRTGITIPDQNHVLLMIKGSIQLGLGPSTIWGDDLIDISPVNNVAAAACALAQDPDAVGGTWHLINPDRTSWESIWSCLRSMGYPIETVDHTTWATRLQSVDESNALFSLASQHTPDEDDERYTWATELTTPRLASLHAGFAPIDDATLTRAFSWLRSQGFLPEPSEIASPLLSEIATV